MDITVEEQAELFPNVVSAREQRYPSLREWLKAFQSHGQLIPQHAIPLMLDISRQRVHHYISSGRLATVKLGGHVYVPLAALEYFLADERKNGRPIKQFDSVGESFKSGRWMAEK